MSKLFIVSGPSGAGEDSIIEGLQKLMPIERVITTTTRDMRPGESNGSPYYFISKDQFAKGVEAGDFVEYAKEYNDNYYGVTKDEIKRVEASKNPGIWKIEYKGVITAKQIFPDITAVFIIAPLKDLENRIRMRDDATEEFVRERMNYTKEWLEHTDIYDFKINNLEGKLEESIKKLKEIIESEK